MPLNSSITVGSPTTINCTGHGMVAGDYVYIQECSWASLNGTFAITYVNADSFTVAVDSTGQTITAAGYSRRVLFLDAEGGNDANDGHSFANRRLTLTDFSAGDINPDDQIRVMATPAPTSAGVNCTFTNESLALTIVNGATLIKEIDLCESGWQGATNVTVTHAAAAARKQGSNVVNIALAAGFTTGKMAWKDLGASGIDFSAYQQISFWFYNSGTLSGITLQLKLCSDQSGDTAVDTFTLPSPTNTSGNWWCLTLDKGSALGNAIKSVALYANNDPGTLTFQLDNIIACKAVGGSDTITLNTLVGKNDGDWWALENLRVSGSDLLADILYHPQAAYNGSRGYSGTTETVALYLRAPVPLYTTSYIVTGVQWTLNDSGTDVDHPLCVSGGWSRTDMLTQTDESWYDGVGAISNFVDITKNMIWVEKLCGVRYYTFFYASSGTITNNKTFYACKVVSGYYGICYLRDWPRNVLFDQCQTLSGGYLLYASGGCSANVRFEGCVFKSLSGSLTASTYQGKYTFKDCTFRNFVYITPSNQSAVQIELDNCEIDTPSTTAQFNSFMGEAYLRNTSVNVTSFATVAAHSRGKVISVNHDDTEGNNMMWLDGCFVQAQSTVRHTAEGTCPKCDVTGSHINANYLVKMPLGKIACTDSLESTVKVWLRRTHANLSVSLVAPGGQLTGVASDVATAMTAAADTWEEVTITFTPTETGVMELEVWSYPTDAVTTYSFYADDLSFTEA